MTHGRTPTVPGKRVDGARSRKRLLDAAITVIARDGLDRFSHRAVAAEAGLSPGLTTYYFKGKQDMLVGAFDRFVERGMVPITRSWDRASGTLTEYLTGALDRDATIARLTELSVEYIFAQKHHQADGVGFELSFLFRPHLDPTLRCRVRDYREQVRQAAATFCAQAGSPDTRSDAALLMGLISRLEFEKLSDACALSQRDAARQLHRLLDIIVAPAPPRQS